jgi:hypothetical protein
MDKTTLLVLLAALSPAQEQSAQKGEDTEGIEVQKAYLIPIEKAWTDENGDTHIEGWISKPGPDLERDAVEPEAFKGAMDEYFALGAPLTTQHQMLPTPERGVFTRYPVGHIQKAAIVRDGQILASAVHPTDPADFQHFPGNGTGVYGRATLTDPTAAIQVAKGNVRGFSWVGRALAKPLPGGRHQFVEILHWRESTIAAFPIHPGANIVAAS